MCQQVRDKLGQTQNTAEDPRQQTQQKGAIDMCKRRLDPVAAYNAPKTGIDTANTFQQGVIDAGNKGYGSPETPGTTSAAPMASPLR